MIYILLAAVLASPAQASTPDEGGRFEVPGVFSVATPKGSDWLKIATRTVAGETSTTYFWQHRAKPDLRAGILVSDRVAATDEERTAAIRRHQQNLRDFAMGPTLKNAKLDEPEIGPPVPELVGFGATAQDASGRTWYIGYTVVFGRKNTYRLEVLAPSRAEADSLMKALRTFREL